MIKSQQSYLVDFIERYIEKESVERGEWIKVSDFSTNTGHSHGTILKGLVGLQKLGKVKIKKHCCEENVFFSFRLTNGDINA